MNTPTELSGQFEGFTVEVGFHTDGASPIVTLMTRADRTGLIMEVWTATYLPACKGCPLALLRKVAGRVENCLKDGILPLGLFVTSPLWSVRHMDSIDAQQHDDADYAEDAVAMRNHREERLANYCQVR